MTRIHPEQLLLPSVLDRLIDLDPTSQVEAESSRTQKLRELKQSVRRDLENLLNTRSCLYPLPYPERLVQLERSLVNYGIPDLSGAAMGGREEREQLRKRIERAIQYFETRFKEVRVVLVDRRYEGSDRTIRFRIEGMLFAEPAPEPVAFDSMLQPSAAISKSVWEPEIHER